MTFIVSTHTRAAQTKGSKPLNLFIKLHLQLFDKKNRRGKKFHVVEYIGKCRKQTEIIKMHSKVVKKSQSQQLPLL